MPFVQRNWKGQITGVFANKQPDYAMESLPEGHPDVLRFTAKSPITSSLLKALGEKDVQQLRVTRERIEKEHGAIRSAVAEFNRLFSELELALSALLSATLDKTGSKVAYAIYYSQTGFDARVAIVDNVIIQVASESAALADLLPLWATIVDRIDGSRRLRTAIR